MDRIWKSGASGTPPVAPAVPSVGFPTQGNPVAGVPATTPGAWWFHMITEELRNVILAAGISPDGSDTDQLLTALQAMFAQAGAINTRDGWSYGSNDWCWLDKARGLKLQWMRVQESPNGSTARSWPIAFTSLVLAVAVTPNVNPANDGFNAGGDVVSTTLTGIVFTVGDAYSSTNSQPAGTDFGFVIAIGV